MPGITIEMRHIDVFFDDFQVLNDISLIFPKGKASFIVGPSGCGKSTLLKTAASIFPPDSGKILYDDKDAYWISERNMEKLRKSNGFLFQDGALWANKSILQNLSLPLEFHFRNFTKEEINERIREVTRQFGLEADLSLRPSQLSQGEMKMASLARALITQPDTIFMDSPLSGLDSDSYQKFMNIMKDLKSAQKTLIITNNDPGLTAKFADCLFVLKNGKLLVSGDFDSVINSRDEDVRDVIKSILNEAPSYDGALLDLLNPGL